jgi:hypothetical protein
VPEVEAPGTASRLVAEGTATAPAEHGVPDLIPDLVPELNSLSDVLLADRQRERER